MNWPKIPGWDCHLDQPDEHHDWRLVTGDASVGEYDYMQCSQCRTTRDATEAELLERAFDDGDL